LLWLLLFGLCLALLGLLLLGSLWCGGVIFLFGLGGLLFPFWLFALLLSFLLRFSRGRLRLW